jgi:hypothetical protein
VSILLSFHSWPRMSLPYFQVPSVDTVEGMLDVKEE